MALPLNERQKEKLEQNFRHQEFVYCLPEELTKETISDVEVILGNVPQELLAYAGKLKWLQLNNAGTEGYCDGALPEEVLLTNATGAYGLAISEHMIGMLFELQKKLNLYAANQRAHIWKEEGNVRLIEGSRVLVIGLGDIGTAFARKMKGLGCRTVGIKRREARKPEGVDDLFTLERLEQQLPKADIVALCLPGYEGTYHMLNEERIAMLKENAVVLNVGRGMTVDTEALTKALREGAYRGRVSGRDRSGASAFGTSALGYGQCDSDAACVGKILSAGDTGEDFEYLHRKSGMLSGKEAAPECN